MQQHLIAIDLDGTTLNNNHQLSPTTIKTLRKLVQQGHLVSIITGRPLRNSLAIYNELAIPGPMGNFNGALLAFPGNDDWQAGYHIELDLEIAFDLFAHQEELGIDLLVAEGRDRLYTSSMNLPDSPFYSVEEGKIARLSREDLTQNPTAITIFTPQQNQDQIKKKLLDRYGEAISVRTWGGELPVLEVVRTGIHKAVALDRLADFYHIPNKNILAFGDEDNDLEMIAYAGLGVAMLNAIDDVKAVAKDITNYTNDDDGLANYLQEYFELEI